MQKVFASIANISMVIENNRLLETTEKIINFFFFLLNTYLGKIFEIRKEKKIKF